MHIALTGSIAGGKSSVLGILERLGWRAVKTDELAWDVINSAEGQAKLKELFSGRLPQKGEIRSRFISEPEFRTSWEAFLHPRIRALWTGVLRDNRQANCVVEVPLLYEKKLEGEFDFVVVCRSNETHAIARWEANGRRADDYRALSSLLIPIDEKIKRTPYIINNDGNLISLTQQTEQLHITLLQHNA